VRRWRKLTAGAALALGACLLVEGVFRLLVPAPADAPLWVPMPGPQGGLAWERSPIHVADPNLFWRNVADADVMFRGVRVRTNEFGMRSDAITRAKPPGTYRILALGESTTFGEYVEQHEPYCAVLQHALDGQPEVEVLNAGSTGYTLVQSRQYLQHAGLAFEPDAVLLYNGYNDYLTTAFLAERLESVSRETGGRTDLEVLADDRRQDRGARAWLLSHSRCLAWIAHRMQSDDVPAFSPRPSDASAGAARPRVPDADRLRMLEELLELTASRGVKLVILIPAYAEFTRHRELLLRFARERGVAALDMEDAVRRVGGERKLLFSDPVHPRAALHRAMGEVIAEYFRAQVLRATAAQPRR
jgi:lysophospholipase L1-like esterase